MMLRLICYTIFQTTLISFREKDGKYSRITQKSKPFAARIFELPSGGLTCKPLLK